MRFALMEAKVALAKLVLAVDMQLTAGHEEVVVNWSGGVLSPKDSVRLQLTPLREEWAGINSFV